MTKSKVDTLLYTNNSFIVAVFVGSRNYFSTLTNLCSDKRQKRLAKDVYFVDTFVRWKNERLNNTLDNKPEEALPLRAEVVGR